MILGINGALFSKGAPIENNELPSRYDWREKNIITPAGHQGDCGACWAFAAVGIFEALIKKETGKTADLSEQHIVSSTGRGCNGGGIIEALRHMKETGIVLEQYFPYKDKEIEFNINCPSDYFLTECHMTYIDKRPLKERVKIIKETLIQYGPVASNMFFYKDLDAYKSGFYVYNGTSSDQGGHNVMIVGWEDNSEIKNGGCWICKNSWGPKWGDNGFFKIAYGECHLDDFYICYGEYKPD